MRGPCGRCAFELLSPAPAIASMRVVLGPGEIPDPHALSSRSLRPLEVRTVERPALFGIAGGPAFHRRPRSLGATALRSMFGASTTALEGLLSARLEGTRGDVIQLRSSSARASGGRTVRRARLARARAGVEIFNHNHVDK